MSTRANLTLLFLSPEKIVSLWKASFIGLKTPVCACSTTRTIKLGWPVPVRRLAGGCAGLACLGAVVPDEDDGGEGADGGGGCLVREGAGSEVAVVGAEEDTLAGQFA
jgi:hypothetical protein